MDAQPSTDLIVLPSTGEIINLDDAEQCANALRAIRALEHTLADTKRTLTQALVFASERMGTKTLNLPSVTAVVRGGMETVYDADAIETELRDAGMPEDRLREIIVETVVVTRKVKAGEAQRAGKANPVYASIIERNSRRLPTTPTVYVQ